MDFSESVIPITNSRLNICLITIYLRIWAFTLVLRTGESFVPETDIRVFSPSKSHFHTSQTRYFYLIELGVVLLLYDPWVPSKGTDISQSFLVKLSMLLPLPDHPYNADFFPYVFLLVAPGTALFGETTSISHQSVFSDILSFILKVNLLLHFPVTSILFHWETFFSSNNISFFSFEPFCLHR